LLVSQEIFVLFRDIEPDSLLWLLLTGDWVLAVTQNTLEVLERNQDDCHIVQRLSVQAVLEDAFDSDTAELVNVDRLLISTRRRLAG
jgi:hypothetical protein